MKNITALFQEVYLPTKALVIYQSMQPEEKEVYVEAYDMDQEGRPINARPLTTEQSDAKAYCRPICYTSIKVKPAARSGTPNPDKCNCFLKKP